MHGDRRGYRTWGHLLMGVVIGLVIVTPALAMPPDLPVGVNDETRLYLLIGSGVLLFAALVMRLMRNRDETQEGVVDAPRSYGMRFFPSDRPIALE
jgi:hypothetical protein